MSIRQYINPKLQNGKLIYLEDDADRITVKLTETMLNKYEESLLRKEDNKTEAS
ncbi:hypothetical protein [Paenibacillus qinlingensis]|uniref:Uncharacterized protein n=1 Tax=Paenibacillus qinlingensis TaxID=1837343 RepID=A0ABU1P723_9BACL|nr:hypothetical protein [Paenibacillus qinlingensis]MDR6555488.1 hypothetical protein [Paenibacillus qinlingensis]